MDRDRLGVQMIPRFTMGPAMPSALTVFVAAFRPPISDPDHVERDVRVAAKEISPLCRPTSESFTQRKIAAISRKTAVGEVCIVQNHLLNRASSKRGLAAPAMSAI